MRYIALDKVVRPMDLLGVRVRMQGDQRVTEGVVVHVVPGGITEDTDLDLAAWVAERFIMAVPVAEAEARRARAAATVTQTVAPAVKAEVRAEVKEEPKAEVVPEDAVEEVAAESAPVARRNRFSKRGA